ncbi:MAG: glycosyltransferase family 2 protein [Aquaticitalea sp.]
MEIDKQLYEFYPIAFFDEQPIRFRSTSKPVVSIIIPVYNQLQYTLNCLYSIQQTCQNIDIEVIVINDKSTDDTLKYLSNIEGLITIHNPENLGFLRNVNNGLIKANGEFILLLNNDVVVFPDFLKELLAVFDEQPEVGAVGSMAIHPSGVVLEAGSLLFNDGTATNMGRERLPSDPKYHYLKPVDYCSGYCLLFRRLFPDGKLVQLDETFLPAYYEETDLCMQLQYDFGLNIYYQPFAKLIHFESISYGQEKDSKKQRLIDLNKEKFQKKWSHVLTSSKFVKAPKRRKVSKEKFLNKLYEGNSYLFGEDVLSDSNLAALNELTNKGHKVYVLLSDDRKSDLIEKLQRQGVEVLYPYVNHKNKKITSLGILRQLSSEVQVFRTNNVWYRMYFAISKTLFTKSN